MWKISFLIFFSLILGSCAKDSKDTSTSTISGEITSYWYAGVGQFNGPLDFGNLTSEQNKILTVTIKNVGDSSLTGPVSISGNDFFLAYQNCATLLPEKTCTVKISFNSQGKLNQSYSENLTIGTQSALVTASVNLPAPVTELRALVGGSEIESLNFGTIKFDQSVMKTLIITNKGKDKGPWVVGQSGNGFVISYDTCSGKEILPTKSCTLKVALSGAGKSGEITDTLTFGNLELPMTAVVKNIETVAQEESDIKVLVNNQIASAGVVDLGTSNLRQTKILNLYLKNEGTDKGIIEEPEISPDYQIAFNNCEPGKVLNPKNSCLMKLVTIPQTKGVQNSPLILQGQTYNLQSTVREPGDKIFCPMDNALESFITWDGSSYSDCLIEECSSGYNLFDNICNPNVISCPIENGVGFQTWNGTDYGDCTLDSCNENYHTEDNLTCVSNTKTCNITNGSGQQTWNGTDWNTCQLTACNANYFNSGNNTCLPGIVATGDSRMFADGTYAISCEKYRRPTDGQSLYAGLTGSGYYNIKPGSTVLKVVCDQVTNNGGWTIFSKAQSISGTIVNWPAYVTDKTQFLFYMYNDNPVGGRVLRLSQISNHSSKPLTFTPGANALTINFVPGVVQGSINGYRFNDTNWAFTNCDSNANSYFRLSTSSTGTGAGIASNGQLWSNASAANFNSGWPIGVTEDYVWRGITIDFGGCGSHTLTNDFISGTGGVDWWTIGVK